MNLSGFILCIIRLLEIGFILEKFGIGEEDKDLQVDLTNYDADLSSSRKSSFNPFFMSQLPDDSRNNSLELQRKDLETSLNKNIIKNLNHSKSKSFSSVLQSSFLMEYMYYIIQGIHTIAASITEKRGEYEIK
jgi:hypothetical protein